jgi:hypothetical protein
MDIQRDVDMAFEIPFRHQPQGSPDSIFPSVVYKYRLRPLPPCRAWMPSRDKLGKHHAGRYLIVRDLTRPTERTFLEPREPDMTRLGSSGPSVRPGPAGTTGLAGCRTRPQICTRVPGRPPGRGGNNLTSVSQSDGQVPAEIDPSSLRQLTKVESRVLHKENIVIPTKSSDVLLAYCTLHEKP